MSFILLVPVENVWTLCQDWHSIFACLNICYIGGVSNSLIHDMMLVMEGQLCHVVNFSLTDSIFDSWILKNLTTTYTCPWQTIWGLSSDKTIIHMCIFVIVIWRCCRFMAILSLLAISNTCVLSLMFLVCLVRIYLEARTSSISLYICA